MDHFATKSRNPARPHCFFGLKSVILAIMFGRITRSCAFLSQSSVSRPVRSIVGVSSISPTRTNYLKPSTTTVYSGFENTRLFSSTAPSADESAIAKSRAPFRMPRNSADDSTQKQSNNDGSSNSGTGGATTKSWNSMGLLTEICTCLREELQLQSPTPVQSLVIPQLLQTEKESMAFLAATG